MKHLDRWLLALVLGAMLLGAALFASRARADVPLCWDQVDGAWPIQRVTVSGLPYSGTVQDMGRQPSGALRYCLAADGLVRPYSWTVQVCSAGGAICSPPAVLASGGPGPARRYDGCRADLNDDQAIGLDDVALAFRAAASVGACTP